MAHNTASQASRFTHGKAWQPQQTRGKGMARKKKLPRAQMSREITLPQPTGWDMGACGKANRHGLQQEEAGEIDATTGKMVNPNNIRRMRRVDMLEHWQRHGTISQAGYAAACKLRNTFENTQRSPDSSFIKERVDGSNDPGNAVNIAVDSISGYHKVYRHVIDTDRPLIDHCVIGGGTPASLRVRGARPYYGPNYASGLIALCAALDRLAKAMEAR